MNEIFFTKNQITMMPTAQLEALLETVTDASDVYEWAEDELATRDYDESDPWSPQNHHTTHD